MLQNDLIIIENGFMIIFNQNKRFLKLIVVVVINNKLIYFTISSTRAKQTT